MSVRIRKSEIFTGAFIIAAIGIFVVLGWNALGTSKVKECVTYFDDVQLLETGNPVAVSGVSVGRVLSLEPRVEGDKMVVRVVWTVEESVVAVMGENSHVSVGQKSFLGNKYLALTPVPGGAELPTEDGRIRVKASPSTDLFAVIDQVKVKAFSLIDRVDAVLSSLQTEVLATEKMGKIWALVDNLDGAVNDVRRDLEVVMDRVVTSEASTLANVDGLVSDLRGFVANLEATVADFRGNIEVTRGKLDGMLTSGARTIDNLDMLLQNDLGPKIGGVVDRTDRILASLEQKLPPLLDDTNGVVDGANDLVRNPELFAAIYELRRSLQEAKLLMMSIRANPAQIIFGGPGTIEGEVPEKKDEREQRTSGRAKRYGY